MYLLFDIGGSSTKIGIIDNNEKLIEKYKIDDKPDLDSFIAMLEEETQKAIDKHGIEGIGISSPGSVNPKTGEVLGISALMYIHDYNFAKHLQDKFNIPVAIENDANCSALAEVHFAGVKDKKIAFFVIGSGIGGAIVKNGLLEEGRRMEVGEFGYMILDYKDGQPINLSILGTLPNVRTRLIKDHGIDQDTYTILDKYFEKEEPYYSEVDKMFNYLCTGIYNVSYSIDPDIIYIGGGISQSEKYMAELKDRLSKGIFADANIDLRPVTHYNDNNLLGAYVNLLNKIEGRY